MAWNKPTSNTVDATSSSRSAGRGKMPRLRRGLLAGIIVVLGAGLAAWLLTNGDDAPAQDTKRRARGTIKDVSPVADTTTVTRIRAVLPQDEEPEKLPEWKDEYLRDSAMRLKFSKLIQARTNESGLITERFSLPNGKTWRRVTEPPPIFENRCDMAIVRAVGEASGAPTPPVPGLDDADLDQEFANSLLEPIVIKDDDKPEVAALKMIVKQTRAQIAEWIKAGDTRSVGEILQDHINLNNRNADMQADAIRQYNKVLAEEGKEFAADYLTKVNESLAAYGVEPVKVGDADDDESLDEGTNEEGTK